MQYKPERPSMKKIVLASNNQGKIKEFQEIFKDLDIEIVPQSEFNVPEINEPFSTFLENSLHKARHCSTITNLPSLADDSGLCVNTLNGAPGIYSARYAGENPKSETRNIEKLLNELKNTQDRSAYFYCCLVLVNSANDPSPIFADGRCYGEITLAPQGSNGFGYDPIFYINQYQKTTAELAPEVKNKISHRGLALQNLFNQLSLGI